jgi:hypothetical protein
LGDCFAIEPFCIHGKKKTAGINKLNLIWLMTNNSRLADMDEDWIPYIGAAIILILVFSSYFLFWRPAGESRGGEGEKISGANCGFRLIDGEKAPITNKEVCEGIDLVKINEGKAENGADGIADCKWVEGGVKGKCEPK